MADHVFSNTDSQRPSEQNPLKNLREKGAWAYPGTAEIFPVLPIISGTGKATNFNFVRTFLVSIGTITNPITNFGKSCRLLVRTLEIFQGTHTLGASRGRLCDSSAFLSSLRVSDRPV